MTLTRIPQKRRSIFANVVAREYGHCVEHSFERNVSRFFEQKMLLHDPEIVSPHRKSVTSLNVDGTTGRFLLAGSADATISIYDISPWGQERRLSNTITGRDGTAGRHNKRRWDDSTPSYHPVARSVKVPAVPDPLDLPGGHSSSITHVQWYPTDAGAFLSTSSDGTILLWDTHRMTPVLRVQPFDDDVAAWVSAHLRKVGTGSTTDRPTLLVAGSWYDSAMKLVDIRSGASSHQLIGHQGGVTTVQWSPTNPNVLASGSKDSSIRLWDIRKSGSRACITVLDRDNISVDGMVSPSCSSTNRTTRVGPYVSDYSHLRTKLTSTRNETSMMEKRQQQLADYIGSTTKKRPRQLPVPAHDNRNSSALIPAPNNYDHLQYQQSRSHNGHVAALEFFESGHHLASVGGKDGELLVWDLRNGCLEGSKFVAPGGLPATQGNQRRVALSVEGSTGAGGTIWISRGEQVLGFGMEGGSPKQILRGHLIGVGCLEQMEPGKMLLSGSKDGMILCWGQPKAAVARGGPVMAEDTDNW